MCVNLLKVRNSVNDIEFGTEPHDTKSIRLPVRNSVRGVSGTESIELTVRHSVNGAERYSTELIEMTVQNSANGTERYRTELFRLTVRSSVAVRN